MSDECHAREGEGQTQYNISLLFSRSTKGVTRFNVPSKGGIAINSMYAFTTHAMLRDLGFNPNIFGRKTSN